MDFVDLTEEQRQAVLHDGNLRLVACPGSGKTACIAFRIGHWITQGVDPKRALAITFTRRAAKEMKKRIHTVAGEHGKSVQASTFHSYFLRFIIRHCYLKNQDAFAGVIDAFSQRNIVEKIILKLGYELELEETLHWIESSKNDLVMPNPKSYEEGHSLYQMEVVYNQYQQFLHGYDLFDFSEILLRSYQMLSTSPIARAYFRKRLEFVAVDESHDINRAQFELMRLITGDGEKANITIVGDCNQSIYGWRGSNPSLILDNFDQHFKGVETLHLTRNFRSSGNIVQVASTILDGNPMITTNPPGKKITLLQCHTEEDQAERIGGIVSGLIEKGTKPKDIAILFRKNCQADVLAWELFVRDIPFDLRDENRRREKEKVSMPFLGQMILISFESAPALTFTLLLLWKFLVLTKKRNKVALMTMHQSKGLEWPAVFLTNLNHEEHLFADEEEEQRLFYVAVTRAKEKLYLSHFGYPNVKLVNLIEANPGLVEIQKRERPEYGEATPVSIFR